MNAAEYIDRVKTQRNAVREENARLLEGYRTLHSKIVCESMMPAGTSDRLCQAIYDILGDDWKEKLFPDQQS